MSQLFSQNPFYWNLITDFRLIWAETFMQNAFIGGTLVAVLGGLVGYFVVLRQMAFANHALGHTGFSGAAAAVVVGIQPIYGLLAFTMVTGGGMAVMGTRASNRDVEIGTMLAFALGLGLLFLSLYQGYATEAYSILFGELLGISVAQLWLTVYATVGVLVVMAFLYRPLLFGSLDEDVAEAKGLPMKLLGLAFMLLLAVSISFAVTVVGVLLIFALTVTPAAIAVRLTRRSWSAILVSITISVTAVWGGLFLSWYLNPPVSFFICGIIFFEYLVVRGSAAIRSSSLLRGVSLPEWDSVALLRSAGLAGIASQALVVVGLVALAPALTSDPSWLWAASTYSAPHAVGVVLLAAGIALAVVSAGLYFLGFRGATNTSRVFFLPTYFSLLGLLGLAMAPAGLFLLVEGSLSAASGYALAPVYTLFGAPLLLAGSVLVFVGVLGQAFGTWQASKTYQDRLFRVGAVLLFLPMLGQGVSSFGYHAVTRRISKGEPLRAPGG